jgi:hypothetical protein
MGWKDIFKKKKNEPDPIGDTKLANLKVGWFVDYDMKSWEVTSANLYDWGEGDISYEWQLKSSDDTIYLEREVDDEDYWSVSRKVPTGKIGSHIINKIKEDEDPSDKIEYDGTTFYLDESGAGYFQKDCEPPGKEVIKWDFTDESESRILTIERWGEDDFEAAEGFEVEEYQFTNILPSEES